MLSGIFSTFPYSTFSQNVGVVRLSGVKSKRSIYFAAVMLMIIGLLPKFGALATTIPTSALGGAMLVLFGKNGITVYPQIFQNLPDLIRLVIENTVVVTSILAVFLNIVIPGRKQEEGA